MKLTIIFLTTLLLSFSGYADNRMKVELTATGHSSSGGRDDLKINFGMVGNEDDFSIEDKLTALREKIAFYKLMKSKKIDLNKVFTATYEEEHLAKVFKELLPNIPIVFLEPELEIRVHSMTLKGASLERILFRLDEAAGVYFKFSEKAILVSFSPFKKAK